MTDTSTAYRGVAYSFSVVLTSQTNPTLDIAQVNPTLATGDVKVSKDGGAFADITALPVVTPAGGIAVLVSLSATEMTADSVLVQFIDAAGAEWKDKLIEIKPVTFGVTTSTTSVITLAAFKAFRGITTTSDDAVITSILEGVTTYINSQTGTQFEATTETRYFDTPEGDTLWLDKDLLTITALTNGDGTSITSASYKLLPLNASPKYAIKLLPSSCLSWQLATAGDKEGAITVTGTWGFSATPPADIVQCALSIASNVYQRRTGQPANDGPVTITAAGVVIQPRDVGPVEASIIANYRKVGL